VPRFARGLCGDRGTSDLRLETSFPDQACHGLSSNPPQTVTHYTLYFPKKLSLIKPKKPKGYKPLG
jgi:hypothetical protein